MYKSKLAFFWNFKVYLFHLCIDFQIGEKREGQKNENSHCLRFLHEEYSRISWIFCTSIKLDVAEQLRVEQNATPTSKSRGEWTLVWVASLPVTNHNTYFRNSVNVFFLSMFKKNAKIYLHCKKGEKKNYSRTIKSILYYIQLLLKGPIKEKRPWRRKHTQCGSIQTFQFLHWGAENSKYISEVESRVSFWDFLFKPDAQTSSTVL